MAPPFLTAAPGADTVTRKDGLSVSKSWVLLYGTRHPISSTLSTENLILSDG